MSTLEPCPLCGGPAQIIAGAPGRYYVRCEGCSLTSDDGSRERVITKWNARHQPQEREAVLEEIAREAATANEVIRLGREREGSGRVKVATALHRISELAARAALTTPAPAVSREEMVLARLDAILSRLWDE